LPEVSHTDHVSAEDALAGALEAGPGGDSDRQVGGFPQGERRARQEGVGKGRGGGRGEAEGRNGCLEKAASGERAGF
jgi:hypothetical protein